MPSRGSSAGTTTADRGSPVVIAGMGLLTPLGHSPWQTFRALLAGRTVTDRADRLPQAADPVNVVHSVGAVSVAQHGPSDPTVELAERAARQALHEAGEDQTQVPVILASSKGAVGSLIRAAGQCGLGDRTRRGGSSRDRTHHPGRLGEPGFLQADLESVTLGPHEFLARQLRRRLGLVEPVHHVVAACASGLTAVDLARRRLASAGATRAPRSVLVVAVEAALTPLFIHSYRRLGVLAPLTAQAYRGRPLAENRCGFVLAEAGAAVLLRTAEEPQPGEIELLDTAVASEPHDLIRPAPRMRSLARVARRLLDGRPIDVLHPHAPGTAAHDPAEMSVFAGHADQIRDVYACKGGVGHGLGAAGLVSLVLACLCARSGKRPPMPWLNDPIPESQPLVGESRNGDGPTRHHAVFASGFGGHVAGAVLAYRQPLPNLPYP